jgi:hypothetical protein
MILLRIYLLALTTCKAESILVGFVAYCINFPAHESLHSLAFYEVPNQVPSLSNMRRNTQFFLIKVIENIE